MNAPISGGTKDATIKGNPAVLRSALGYNAASRAAQGGEQAMDDAIKFLVGNMLRSFSKKIEIEMFYGQSGYGSVASVSGNIITITTAEFAAGIWIGSENMPVQIRSSAGVLRGNAIVTYADIINRQITLDVMPAGVVATDVIYHQGAYGNEFVGLHKILSTTSGSLFGIDVSTSSLFQGNTYSAGSAALSFTKIVNAAAVARFKGQNGKLICIINPKAWSNVLTDQAALRRYDSSQSDAKLKNGSESIEFHSMNGVIEVVSSIYVKEGKQAIAA